VLALAIMETRCTVARASAPRAVQAKPTALTQSGYAFAASPIATIELPIGSTVVTVDDPRFAGVYACEISARAPMCEIQLLRKTAKPVASKGARPQKGKRTKPRSNDDESMFNHLGKPKGEKSMFNRFDKKQPALEN
jgi:hypothetical protein